MAEFLTTSTLNFLLEELIKLSKEQLILISPYLKLNDRMRELLLDKKGQVKVIIIYGKLDLQPREKEWFAQQQHIITRFCRNLHAKCYLNEHCCIVTSMNLYDFSQVNNNEIGVSIHKRQDKLLYNAAYEEAQRLIRISEAKEIFPGTGRSSQDKWNSQSNQSTKEYAKLTTAKLAVHYGKSTEEMREILLRNGWLELVEGKYKVTEKGKRAGGGEERRGRYQSSYFLWNKPKAR
mgnify:CR=1 FL=1